MKLKTILFSLFLLIFGLSNAQKAASGGNSLEFIPNKGQIVDMNGKVRNDILYTAHAGTVQVYLKSRGLSYIVSTVLDPRRLPGYKDNEPPGEEILIRIITN